MRELILTARFRRDLRRAARRGKDGQKLSEITERLIAGETLHPRHRVHQLVGNWAPLRECHIENDWLLVWDEDDTTVTLIRTGTHADIFG